MRSSNSEYRFCVSQTYPYLPSGNVLVSDSINGLFVVKPNAPYGRPSWLRILSQLDQVGGSMLTWTASTDARGYSVLRSTTLSGPFEQIAEHLTEMSYVDESSPFAIRYYKVIAKNGEGTMESANVVSSDGVSFRVRSKASKRGN